MQENLAKLREITWFILKGETLLLMYKIMWHGNLKILLQ